MYSGKILKNCIQHFYDIRWTKLKIQWHFLQNILNQKYIFKFCSSYTKTFVQCILYKCSVCIWKNFNVYYKMFNVYSKFVHCVFNKMLTHFKRNDVFEKKVHCVFKICNTRWRILECKVHYFIIYDEHFLNMMKIFVICGELLYNVQ